MAVSMREVDSAFQGAGQKALPSFATALFLLTCRRDEKEEQNLDYCNPLAASIIVLERTEFLIAKAIGILNVITVKENSLLQEYHKWTTAQRSGALQHDIHYWLGKDVSQDEAGTAAIKTVELDAALGGHAVQYREVQGHETNKFLSYFRPCIVPQPGGVASGFKHIEGNDLHKIRLFICKGKHIVHVNEVPFARSSLNHDDIFILDTKSKIFQFNGSNSSIQERARALEVVQYVKDAYHDGKCDIAIVEDGKLMADVDAGEFWGFFGGFAPLPRKIASEDNVNGTTTNAKLACLEKGQTVPVVADKLARELLNTNKCYLLDCGFEVFVWMGRSTSLEERKNASVAAENIDVAVSEDGRGKVAALIKRQGFKLKAPLKDAPPTEEPKAYIDCTGNLQVWRVSGSSKDLLPSNEQFKFYSGDSYIFQYTFAGAEKEEYLVGTWFGKKSVQEERTVAISLATKMVDSLKFQPIQGGVSFGYKKFVGEMAQEDETYTEEGIALFRVQGSGPDNMQAIQVDSVASSLNSSYCYILHNGNAVFTWLGSFTTAENQEVVERLLDIIKVAYGKDGDHGLEVKMASNIIIGAKFKPDLTNDNGSLCEGANENGRGERELKYAMKEMDLVKAKAVILEVSSLSIASIGFTPPQEERMEEMGDK
ncbi:hypothetical protein HPP92_012994 [Vanilla planifolia]|uniref:Gelsolin-like domain-containing protein n=1 Tax=Vanilla planifolia TaxID=51239 RepID=A0A835QY75_VANPL|nr:hypothetical protein HPP92_012994 [Vanilla planifolia]